MPAAYFDTLRVPAFAPRARSSHASRPRGNVWRHARNGHDSSGPGPYGGDADTREIGRRQTRERIQSSPGWVFCGAGGNFHSRGASVECALAKYSLCLADMFSSRRDFRARVQRYGAVALRPAVVVLRTLAPHGGPPTQIIRVHS